MANIEHPFVNAHSYQQPSSGYANQIHEQRWNQYKARIIELHNNRLGHSGIQQKLAQEHDLHITLPQLRRKLKQWGLRVYNITQNNTGRLSQASQSSLLDSQAEMCDAREDSAGETSAVIESKIPMNSFSVKQDADVIRGLGLIVDGREYREPVVDGKYYDPKTGELLSCIAEDHGEYSAPPAVDIVVTSLHADTTQCVFRAARLFPLELLLFQIVQVVRKRSVKVDSLTATPYAIRIVLAHELTVDAFFDAAFEMANGVWKE